MTRRVLILGATSGIAREAMRCFAAEGARLFLVARDQAKLTAMADDLRIRGAESVETFQADLTDYSVHLMIIDRAFGLWGGFDAALIAHGTLPVQRSAEMDMDLLRNAIEINYLSAVMLLAQLANRFEEQRSGVLTVIGSVAGDRGRRSNYIYGSAKAAVATYVAGLRLRLAPVGVQVVLIKPGWVSTAMTSDMRQNFLFISGKRAGRGVYGAMISPRAVVYLPWYWRWLMGAVRLVPEAIFAKLNL